MKKLSSVICLVLLILMSGAPAMPVGAQVKPAITVAPVWRPGTQLDTIDEGAPGVVDPGDDFRYVDLEIYVQGNIQFWAVDLSCVVNKALLGVTPGGIPDDDEVTVTWGPNWGAPGTHFTEVPQAYNPATGMKSITATRRGGVEPLGLNGPNYTLLLATLRFKVLPQTAQSVISTLTCPNMQFLDRNGTKVVTPTLAKVPNLTVFTGYTLSGNVKYQGAASHAGIGVSCDWSGTGPDPAAVRTDAAGNFKFTNLRGLGRYDCAYFGNITTAEPSTTPPAQQNDMYLGGATRLYLTTSSYTLLPVLLRGGNASHVGGSAAVIDTLDIGMITGSFRFNTASLTPAPFTEGDVSGDRKVDEIDLAILGSSFGLSETELSLVSNEALRLYSHMLYGLARNYDGLFPNSRIWVGHPVSGAVTPLFSSTFRDFWPTLSPDGTKVAFSRYSAQTARYDLYSATLTGVAAKLTPAAFTQYAFAPSWSPDGTRLAFICASKGLTSGYEFNQGNVCVVDADGRNFSQIGVNARIYPPAWFGSNVLIYAGLSSSAVCPNKLCFYDFSSGSTGSVTAGLEPGYPASPQVLDMPVVRGLDLDADGVPDEYWLFYRFFDGAADSKIRAAIDVTYTAGAFTLSLVGPLHGDAQMLGGGAPLSTDVDYYNVSPNLGIAFYNRSPANSNFYNAGYSLSGLEWALSPSHSVDGYVGLPAAPAVPTQPSDRFALRATFEWLP